MRYIKLSKEEEQQLKELYQQSRYVVERRRSQCLLLSHQGKDINELASIFGVKRLCITQWLDKWEAAGQAGILLQAGRGRKRKLSGLKAEQLESYVAEHRRNLNAVVALLKDRHAVEVSKKTLQRFLKTKPLHFPQGAPQFKK